jgi:hypothetical protein
MLLVPNLPASWLVLLETLRPLFARAGTFRLFVVLATGLVARPVRRTVVGMLAGACMTAVISFHSACRFFSQHRWDTDQLGLAVARLIVSQLLPTDAPIEVVFDDTLFRRWGRRVHHAFWTHDGAAQGPVKIGRGNRWVIAGILVELPFCDHRACLPVLFRLWAGKGTASPVELAGQLLGLLAEAFPHRVHGVGDAAYHGKPLLVAGTTFTTRLPANATLYALAPPRTGRRGRPRLKGGKLGKLAQLATTASWQKVRVHRYGRLETVELAVWDAIWYGAFGNTDGRVIMVREAGSSKPYELALFTTDRISSIELVVARYAGRWGIEVAIETGKQILGVGQARNRVRRAVERTVPFGFLVQTLVVVWYARHGYHPDDLTSRQEAEPWYDQKSTVAFEDMLGKLRRTLIAAQFMPVRAGQPDPHIFRDYALACAAAST